MPGTRRDAVDDPVGRNIRMLRRKRGLSQSELAKKIDATFQQIQGFENGRSRGAEGRLFRIAGVLGARVGAFLAGCSGRRRRNRIPPRACPSFTSPDSHVLRLKRAFSALASDRLPLKIVELIEMIGALAAGEPAPRR